MSLVVTDYSPDAVNNVPVGSTFTFWFNEDLLTVTDDGISFTDQSTETAVAFDLAFTSGDNYFTVTPSTDLPAETVYTIDLPANSLYLIAESGDTLSDPFELEFSTGDLLDEADPSPDATESPLLLSGSITNNAPLVVASELKMTLSETPTSENVTLTAYRDTVFGWVARESDLFIDNSTAAIDGNTITFTATAALTAETTYKSPYAYTLNEGDLIGTPNVAGDTLNLIFTPGTKYIATYNNTILLTFYTRPYKLYVGLSDLEVSGFVYDDTLKLVSLLGRYSDYVYDLLQDRAGHTLDSDIPDKAKELIALKVQYSLFKENRQLIQQNAGVVRKLGDFSISYNVGSAGGDDSYLKAMAARIDELEAMLRADFSTGAPRIGHAPSRFRHDLSSYPIWRDPKRRLR